MQFYCVLIALSALALNKAHAYRSRYKGGSIIGSDKPVEYTGIGSNPEAFGGVISGSSLGIGPSLENQRIDDLNGGAISGIGDLNGMIPDIKGGNGGISSAGQFDQFEQAIGKDDLASIGELDGVATPSNGGNNGFGAGGFRQTAIGATNGNGDGNSHGNGYKNGHGHSHGSGHGYGYLTPVAYLSFSPTNGIGHSGLGGKALGAGLGYGNVGFITPTGVYSKQQGQKYYYF